VVVNSCGGCHRVAKRRPSPVWRPRHRRRPRPDHSKVCARGASARPQKNDGPPPLAGRDAPVLHYIAFLARPDRSDESLQPSNQTVAPVGSCRPRWSDNRIALRSRFFSRRSGGSPNCEIPPFQDSLPCQILAYPSDVPLPIFFAWCPRHCETDPRFDSGIDIVGCPFQMPRPDCQRLRPLFARATRLDAKAGLGAKSELFFFLRSDQFAPGATVFSPPPPPPKKKMPFLISHALSPIPCNHGQHPSALATGRPIAAARSANLMKAAVRFIPTVN